MVLDHQSEYSSLTAALEVISKQVGVGRDTLRRWVRQHQIDHGAREGVSTDENTELKQLRMENRRLKETNEILRRASILFAGEPDPRSSRSWRSSRNSEAKGSLSSRSVRSFLPRVSRSQREPTGPGLEVTSRSLPAPSLMHQWRTTSARLDPAHRPPSGKEAGPHTNAGP